MGAMGRGLCFLIGEWGLLLLLNLTGEVGLSEPIHKSASRGQH